MHECMMDACQTSAGWQDSFNTSEETCSRSSTCCIWDLGGVIGDDDTCLARRVPILASHIHLPFIDSSMHASFIDSSIFHRFYSFVHTYCREEDFLLFLAAEEEDDDFLSPPPPPPPPPPRVLLPTLSSFSKRCTRLSKARRSIRSSCSACCSFRSSTAHGAPRPPPSSRPL